MGLNDFGTRMKAIRKAKGLSQTAMGKLLGVHYIHVGRYESGKATPSLETIVAMARALDVSIDWLALGDEAKTHLGDEELFHLFKQVLTLGPEDRLEAKRLLGDFIAARRNKTEEGTAAPEV